MGDKEGRDAGGGVLMGAMEQAVSTKKRHEKCQLGAACRAKKRMSGGDGQLLSNFLVISEIPLT